MERVEVLVQKLPHGRGLPLPEPATEGSSGVDLRAAVPKEMVVAPGEAALVPTGMKVAIPPGYEGQVRPRSGLALEHGVTVLNAPGTIDSDYRGEVQVLLVNLGKRPFRIARGDRIAQLVIVPVARARYCSVEQLPASGRGEAGFGHSGIK